MQTGTEVAEQSAPSETEEEDILLEQPEDAMREEVEEYEEGSDNETDLDEYTPDEEDYVRNCFLFCFTILNHCRV